MKTKTEKRYLANIKLTAFCIAFIILTVLVTALPTKSEAEIYDDVIRLHVTAASDGEFDTALKILVKDAILEEISGIYAENDISGDTALAKCENARSVLEESLPRIESAARSKAGEFNVSDVTVSLSKDRFPEKTYGNVTLPAGYYESLIVTIGEGRGHNWWCVVYPIVCLSPSSPAVVLKETGFTNDQIDVLSGSGGYVIKFKLLEFINRIFGK